MKHSHRVVLDTSVLVSSALLRRSAPADAVCLVIRRDSLLASQATLVELAEALGRGEFDRYMSIEGRKEFLRTFNRLAEPVVIVHVVRACRDPKDDKFLELAANGMADVILTGDNDLLVLHPFCSIPVITPAAFLADRG